MIENEYFLQAGLIGRGYRSEVVQALLPFGGKQLSSMDALDDQAFGTRTGSKATPEFNSAYNNLKTLGKTNVTFATAMAEQYKKDPKGYAQMMNNLAKTMEKDPAFASKIGEMAQTNDSKKLIALTNDYQNDPGATYKTLMNPPKAPATPVSTTVTTAAPAKTTTAPKKGQGKGKTHKVEPATEKQTPVPTTTEGPAVIAPITGPLSAAQAKERFEKIMKDPKNELGALIHVNGMEEDILKQLEKNPDLVKNFDLPANESEYIGLLKSGKKAEFLSSFTGPDPAKTAEMGLAGIMGGTGLSGMGDFGKMLDGLFGGLFGKSSGPGGSGGMFSQFTNLLSRIFGGGENNGMAVLGGGTTLVAMLNHPGNKAIDAEHIADQSQLAVQNLKSANPQVRKFGQEYLKEVGVTDRGDLDELQQGRARISHVDITLQTEKDAHGNVTSKKVPVAHVVRYNSAEEMQAALSPKIAAATPTPPPKLEQEPSVPGADVRTYPLKPQEKIDVRPLEPSLTPPTTAGA